MDGADCNRQFIKIHFNGKDPVKDHFVTTNVYTGTLMVFIMDPKVDLIWFSTQLFLVNLGLSTEIKKMSRNIFHGLAYKISFL